MTSDEQLKKHILDLKDANLEVRLEAVRALRDLKDDRAIPPLIEALDYQGPFYEFEEIRDALLSFGNLAVQALIEVLNARTLDAHWPFIVQVLGYSGNPAAIPILIATLEDKDEDTAKMAAISFRGIGSEAVESLLIKLNHPNEQIKIRVIMALGEITDDRIIEPLMQQLDNQKLRPDAARALGNYARDDVIEKLVFLLQDTNPNVRFGAVISLGAIRATSAIDALVVLVSDPDESVRINAISVLGRLGDAKVLSSLIGALQDPITRGLAVEALGNIGEKSALPHIIALRESADLWLAARINEAIAKLEQR
ncbi:MAG: HEAT repeat domain-containing protein [Anaerolineae bacterium]|nr:HEAT repeat domain-containing protein [Anaerolineae bacterium]